LLVNPASCSTEGFVHVGTLGSSNKCDRSMVATLLHFKLPDHVLAEGIEQVVLSFYVASARRGGVPLRLDGLGIRPGDLSTALEMQEPDDFYAGGEDPTDPVKDVVQIDSQMLAPKAGQGFTHTYSSPALTEYVRAQVAAGGAGQHLVLRLGSQSWLGCASSACRNCDLRRYTITRSSEVLSITGTFPLAALARDTTAAVTEPAVDPAVLTALWADELLDLMRDDEEDEDDPEKQTETPWFGSPVGVGVFIAGAGLLVVLSSLGTFLFCRRHRLSLRASKLRDSTGHHSVPRTSFGMYVN
jgi:hypothetical protein